MIQGRMKPQIAHRDSAPQRQSEGLDPAIEILVIDRVLIMPNPSDWAGHLVGNERSSIRSRLGLNGINGRSGPGTDGWSRSHRGSNGRKGEARRAGNIETTIGGVVVHVALAWVGLAPDVLRWSDELRFGALQKLQCLISTHAFRARESATAWTTRI